MKKLICAEDVEVAQKQGQKVFYIDCDTIVTPLAKDAAKIYEIEFSTKSQDCDLKNPCEMKSSELAKDFEGGIDSDMIYKVFKTMMNKGLLNEILDLFSDKPYVAESDCGGLKVVRGNSVKFDTFDTGSPNDKVFYQELINKDDSSISAGFLTIDDSSFNRNLTYEEIDYVIEGTLTIMINGKTFTAYPGDVIYVPSGSRVVWGSPDKVKLFYITYPSNKA
ncbi:cupin domain-containing protein [Anaerosalibacter massiliensis]|uniref:Cupin domain-containing protein n=1 Tax=Anaerosalibacter massiliensis TaxID=1347392 RepID=A0A9X2MGZ1_9FIRM|nr:cupin domain-containing protein [Anaerosalibacter massiliensis]MCR2044917.1 cupin domain-containing protein [Anaerosalibacter massiliensis]